MCSATFFAIGPHPSNAPTTIESRTKLPLHNGLKQKFAQLIVVESLSFISFSKGDMINEATWDQKVIYANLF